MWHILRLIRFMSDCVGCSFWISWRTLRILVFPAQMVDLLWLVCKDGRLWTNCAMEETPSNLRLKPINHLSEEKKCRSCHNYSCLLFKRERFIQTFKQVAHAMTPAKDNSQHKIANFVLVCMKAVHTVISHILGMLYVHKKERSCEKCGHK